MTLKLPQYFYLSMEKPLGRYFQVWSPSYQAAQFNQKTPIPVSSRWQVRSGKYWISNIKSPNIRCFWLYVTNVMITYIRPFFERLKWNSIFDCSIFTFHFRWKHVCVQTWKQSIQTYKNHVFAGPRSISSKNASVPNIFNVSLFRYTQHKPQTATWTSFRAPIPVISDFFKFGFNPENTKNISTMCFMWDHVR